ncbi:MAG TPA: sensor histidine kinase [Polyangiaceae bacterium]|nr:sensor histidine kinase [Polyangiaceae bacterium]
MTIRWPRIDARPAVALLALASFVGLAQGFMIRFLAASRGATPHEPIVLFQLTGAIAAWASIPVAQLTALNAPSPTSPPHSTQEDSVYRSTIRWTRFLVAHLVGYVAFSAVHIACIRGLRWLLLHLSIVGTPDGPLGARVLWEMQNDMVVYACAAAILTMMRAFHERDETALRTYALEARLAEARLDALAAQVDPHFFYNALNTISATMYDDLPRTERYLASLAAIMRATLADGSRTWTLDDERAHTERYLELMTARFGDRLRATWTQEGAVGSVLVPRFAVQSLVENSVKHNARRREPLHIHIDVRRQGDDVVVSVADDGVGFSEEPVPLGRGLGRLEETLRLLHGSVGSLKREVNEGGGARVRWIVPYTAP